MSESGEVEDLQVSFDQPGASLASGEPKRWRLRTRAVLALVAAAVIVVAADRLDTATSSRTAIRVALTMASPYPTLEVAPSVRNFVNRVRQLSNGRMRIDMVERPAGPTAPDAIEQQVVTAVQTGDADLGWVGTRALGSMGVGGAQAFTAPMLIDSYQLQQAVFHHGLPDRILPDLARLSVTGLAVLAGGLDKRVAADWPLLEPSDWRGVAVQIASSGVEVDAIRSLAGTPVHLTAGTPSMARAADTSLLTL